MPQYSLVQLQDANAVRDFAYKSKVGGFIGMTEDEVKSALKSTLESLGYEVHVKWGKKSGSDVYALAGSSKIVIEAKGEGSSRQMLGNYFLNALGEILQRMTENDHEYGVALPAHSSYVELVLKLPKRAREALRLDFYFVKPRDTKYDVGIYKWYVG